MMEERSLEREVLERHYGRMGREGGYVAKCKMWLPDDLAGARVLDVGCRRGKGVYEISERVGRDGFVVGVDWNPEFLERARQGEARALARSGLQESNMAFVLGYPEEADEAARAFAPFDAAIANSVLNLACDRAASYAAIARALKPGGLFYYAAVVADQDAGEDVLRAAIAGGDARAAAMGEERLLGELRTAGFAARVTWRDEDFPDAPGRRQVVVEAHAR